MVGIGEGKTCTPGLGRRKNDLGKGVGLVRLG